MAPVSRTTTTPHDIINCKECLRVRLVQIKGHSNKNGNPFAENDENDNQINIHHASKYQGKTKKKKKTFPTTSYNVFNFYSTTLFCVYFFLTVIS